MESNTNCPKKNWYIMFMYSRNDPEKDYSVDQFIKQGTEGKWIGHLEERLLLFILAQLNF